MHLINRLCPTILPFHQEEVAVKVYEDIDDDEEESVKVCLSGGGGVDNAQRFWRGRGVSNHMQNSQ